MQTYATPKAVEKFISLLNLPKSSIYIDTCFGKSDNKHHAIGLEFILNQKEAILCSGKKIIVIHYVAEELKKKKAQGHHWAEDTLNTIFCNPEIFEIRGKSDIEKELDSTEHRSFADEALRRIAIADVSQGYWPALLTADYACALAITTNVYTSITFILDWTTGRPTVRDITDFMKRFKGLYAMECLSSLFSKSDIVLTSSALRSKELNLFLDLLKRTVVQGKKLPVYIHETALAKASNLPASFLKLAPHLHVIPKGSYTEDFFWIQATFTTRSTGRDIVIVGNNHSLEHLKERLDHVQHLHTNRRADRIKYYQIGTLGMLRGIKSLNSHTSEQSAFSIENIITAANENTSAGTTAPDIMKAAQEGNTRAMGVLSSMYEHGYAVRKSPTMAQLWKERRIAIIALRKRRKQQAAELSPSLFSRFKCFVADVDCYIKNSLTQLILIK